MQTYDQKRARHAYDKVKDVPDDKRAKFKSLALKFPAMVLQCGVLSTLAFYETQKQDDKRVFKAIDDWLTSHSELPWKTTQGSSRERLHAQETSLWLYRMAAREALAYGAWLKRATEALLGDVKADI